MLTEGTIHLARKIQEHWVWQDRIRRELWLEFILNCRPSSTPFQQCGPWVVKRRQLVRAATDLANQLGTNRSKVRREMVGMVSRGMISMKTQRGRSGHYSGHLITVRNFDEYNAFGVCMMADRPFTEPSSSTPPPPSGSTHAREVDGADELRSYLGDHAWIVDALADELTSKWWARAILSWYGPHGQRHVHFGGIPFEERPGVLAGGLAAYLEAVSGQPRGDLHQKTLGACVRGSAEETVRKINASPMTAREEQRTELERRTSGRDYTGSASVSELLGGPQIHREEPQPARAAPWMEWYNALPEDKQKVFYASALAAARKEQRMRGLDKLREPSELAIQVSLQGIIMDAMNEKGAA